MALIALATAALVSIGSMVVVPPAFAGATGTEVWAGKGAGESRPVSSSAPGGAVFRFDTPEKNDAVIGDDISVPFTVRCDGVSDGDNDLSISFTTMSDAVTGSRSTSVAS